MRLPLFLAALITAGNAGAEEIPVRALDADEPRSVALYNSQCSIEVAHECIETVLACDLENSFTATFLTLSSFQVAQWLMKEDYSSSIEAGGKKVPMLTSAMLFNELNVGWDIVLLDTSDEAWPALQGAETIALHAGGHTKTLRLDAASRGAVNDVAVNCLAEWAR